MQGKHKGIEKRLWIAAEELRADSKLMASEYSLPVLGLIFIFFILTCFKGESELRVDPAERLLTAVTGIFITRGNYSSDGVQAF